MGLFLLREVFNPIIGGVVRLLPLRACPTGAVGDEIQIARMLELPDWSLLLPLGIISLAALLWMIFRYMPRDLGGSFVAGGLAGAVVGYLTWFGVLGPILLP